MKIIKIALLVLLFNEGLLRAAVVAVGSSVSKSAETNACSICLDHLMAKDPEGATEKPVSNPREFFNCDHVFHRGCVAPWIVDPAHRCPECRAKPYGKVVQSQREKSTKDTLVVRVEPIYFLHDAVLRGNVKEVKKLIAKGCDPNMRDESQRTVLHLAIEAGALAEEKDRKNYSAIIRHLVDLKNGPSLGAPDAHGRLALHIAIEEHYVEAVSILVDQVTYLNASNTQKQSPLVLAVSKFMDSVDHSASVGSEVIEECMRVIDVLLRVGADVSSVDRSGKTPLALVLAQLNNGEHYVLKTNVIVSLLAGRGGFFTKESDELREQKKAAVNRVFDAASGEYPLHKMITCWDATEWDSSLKVLEAIIAAGADINQPMLNGQTPLHLAAQAGVEEVIKLLTKHGANFMVRDTRGALPMHYAAAVGNKKILALFTQHKNSFAMLTAYDRQGYTPLHYAVRTEVPARAAIETIQHILDTPGSDLNAKRSAKDKTPLMCAIEAHGGGVDNMHIIRFLAESPNNAQLTKAMHTAAAGAGNSDDGLLILTFLHKKNPRLATVPDEIGRTPLHYAALEGRDMAVAWLVEKAKANVNDTDCDGKTAFDLAQIFGKRKYVNVCGYLAHKMKIAWSPSSTQTSGSLDDGFGIATTDDSPGRRSSETPPPPPSDEDREDTPPPPPAEEYTGE